MSLEMNLSETKSLIDDTINNPKSNTDLKNRCLTNSKAVLNWIRFSVGIGIFQLPYLLKELGLILGVLSLILSSFITYYSCYYLFYLSEKNNINSFEKLVNKLLNRVYSKIFNFFLIIDIGFLFMLNPIVAWKQIEYITSSLGYKFLELNKEKYFNMNFLYRSIFFMLLFLICIPYFLKPKITNFQILNDLYLLTLFLIILTIIIQFPFFYYKNLKEFDIFPVNYFNRFNHKSLIFFSNLLLSFYIQPFLMDIKKELIDPSLNNIKKISKISISIQFTINLSIAVLGYLSVGNNNMVEIINNRKSVFKNDYLMMFFNFSFAIFMIIGVPVFNVSFRNYIYSFLEIKKTTKNFYFISLIPCLIFIIWGILYPYVINLFSILASLICNYNGYIIIFVMSIKYIKQKKLEQIHKADYIILNIFLIFMLFLFFYFILDSFISNIKLIYYHT